MSTIQLGKLAIVCAGRRDTLLQILNGKATVHLGYSPARIALSADWQDGVRIQSIIHELNHSRFMEETNNEGRAAA